MKPASIETLDILIKFLRDNGGFHSKLDDHMKLAYDNVTNKFYCSIEAYQNCIQHQYNLQSKNRANSPSSSNYDNPTTNRLKMIFNVADTDVDKEKEKDV